MKGIFNAARFAKAWCGFATKSGRYTYYQHWAILGVGKEMYQSQGCPGQISNMSSVVNPGNGDQQKQTPGVRRKTVLAF